MKSTIWQRFSADICMGIAVTIWGLHFIVVKDALDTLSPLVFNALRIAIALLVLFGWSRWHKVSLRIDRRDRPRLITLGLVGQLAHQLFFVLSLDHTTSTNTALLIATAPTWIAVLSMLLGIIQLKRALIVGVAVTLTGVTLVTLGQPGAGLSVSSRDIVGLTLGLGSALALASYNITIKPFMDRYGGLPIVIWIFTSTLVGLVVAAAPDLAALDPAGLTPRIWLSLLYSGGCSAALGYMLETHALRTLGSTRAGTYYNAMPVIAAIAGILLLDDPLTALITLGVILTLGGVILVRRNSHARSPQADLTTRPVAAEEYI
jgi:drug/metabolite transporter (DMT)-like permease